MAEKVYVNENEPTIVAPGFVGAFTIVRSGVDELDAGSADTKIYLGDQEVSSSLLSGSDSLASNAHTSQTVSIPSDGSYDGKVLTLELIHDYQGITDPVWLLIHVGQKQRR